MSTKRKKVDYFVDVAVGIVATAILLTSLCMIPFFIGGLCIVCMFETVLRVIMFPFYYLFTGGKLSIQPNTTCRMINL